MTITEQDFASIDFALREELTELVARERGLCRSNRLFGKCRDEASRLMAEYRHRLPFPPTTKIEEVLVRVIENHAAHCAYREELATSRAKQVEELLAQVPKPDANIVKIVVRDERTGRPMRLSLPAEWVETRWE